MKTKEALVIFEDLPIRKVEHKGTIYISALDVAKALEYENPSVAVATVIGRNNERFEKYLHYQNDSSGGQNRKMVFLNLKGVIAFCNLSKQKKAVPFQRWADEVLEKELLNIPNNIKILATRKRVEFTDVLKEHGYKSPHEYIQTTKQMKKTMNIEKPKAECDLIELMKIATAEMLARTNIMQTEANGYHEVNPICNESAKVIEQATRKQITLE